MTGKIDFHSKKIREALRFAMKNTLLEVGVRASNQIKMLTPVITGRLRASIGPTAALNTGDHFYLHENLPKKVVRSKSKENQVVFENIQWTKEDFEKLGAYKEEGDLRAFVVIGTNVKYAPYVEFGTYRRIPRPYMRPGMEMEFSRMKSYIPESFKRYFIERLKQLGMQVK